ncbi:MAG: PIN domain-containing protein [Candidatus Limnocylindrales bacterium]|nr:PIN domain-containing protein [Candidatus Limnocylindrales bacterium]
MRYVLDTTLLIDHSKARPGVAELVASLFAESSDLYVCDVVVAEALSGGDAIQRATIESLIRALEYVSTPPDAAVWAADSRRQRRASGPRSLADAIIAGVARFHDATVVTRNPRDFEIQGVRVLGYG